MAEDQNTKPKTMDINDLVRELSKSSTSPVAPTPPSAPSSQAPRPPFPTPVSPTTKPFVPTPAPSPVNPPVPKPMDTPRPLFTPPLKPVSPPSYSPTPPPTVSGVKEYQSSIRTMNEDISKLKQGQQPAGIPVPRKVEQTVPVVPVPVPPKPTVPSPQFKVPSVSLGETKKSGPLVQSKDISKPQIYVPQESYPGGNRNMLFMAIGVVAVAAGFAYWFFVLRSPASEVVIETPTPTPTATPTPTPTLSSIFSGINTQTALVTTDETVSNFVKDINSGAINGGEFIKIYAKMYTSENELTLPITQLLDNFKLPYPVDLRDLISQDYGMFSYGQKEIFDTKGQVKTNAVVEKRLVFINEIKDTAMVAQLVKVWETDTGTDIAYSLKTIFQFDPKKQQSKDFTENSYKEVVIRYKNFKYSDRSIDYAIVPASNGKSYLVISGSRESMYATIDKLKGF